MKAMPRRAEMLAEVYQLLAQKKYAIAQAQAAQSLKACGQVALNDGDWRRDWCYTGSQDPLSRLEFTGAEEEALAITSWLDAKLTHRQQTVGEILPARLEEGPELSPHDPKGGGKGKDKKGKGKGKAGKGAADTVEG